ncbi:hypothetical protein SDC9_202761 [bioreactor metagenome]|uniref:Uncharacterized protein n=1 Tax=bioreactor metagenome TaxID=1076179 RepID=A0A645IW39_9ZZZZ
MALPDMVPNNALDNTATLAGPPLYFPAAPVAKSIKNCPPAKFCRNAPNKQNKNTKLAVAVKGEPNIPTSP